MQPHRFYYYLPGRESRPSPEELVELGLTNRLNGHAHTCLKKGPDGGRGVIVGCDEGPIIFDAESQVWRHYPAAGWWLGNVKDKAPRPEDLERQPMLPGRMCTLGDGRDWLIPVARLLPQKATLDEQGKWTAERDPRFDALWVLSERLLTEYWGPVIAWERDIAQVRADERPEDVPASEKHSAQLREEFNRAVQGHDRSLSVRVLAHNYRIGAEETCALGLFDVLNDGGSPQDLAIVHTLVDGSAILAAQSGKKNAAAVNGGG